MEINKSIQDYLQLKGYSPLESAKLANKATRDIELMQMAEESAKHPDGDWTTCGDCGGLHREFRNCPC